MVGRVAVQASEVSRGLGSIRRGSWLCSGRGGPRRVCIVRTLSSLAHTSSNRGLLGLSWASCIGWGTVICVLSGLRHDYHKPAKAGTSRLTRAFYTNFPQPISRLSHDSRLGHVLIKFRSEFQYDSPCYEMERLLFDGTSSRSTPLFRLEV